MTLNGGENGHSVGNGFKPRLGSLAVVPRAAQHDEIDDALDGVVMTVDDLVRDLADDALEFRRRRYRPGSARPADLVAVASAGRPAVSGRSHTVRKVALVVVVVLLVVAIEYALLQSILSGP
jgi:hypothetical protein